MKTLNTVTEYTDKFSGWDEFDPHWGSHTYRLVLNLTCYNVLIKLKCTVKN